MTNSSKQNHDRPSGTPIIPEDNHIPRTERNSVQTQTLPELELEELLLAAQYVLSGKNPPQEEARYFSQVVEEQLFDTGVLRYELEGLAGRLTPEEGERLSTCPTLQKQVLEPGIREVLGLLSNFPRYQSQSLSDSILQACRRDVTWLLGRWMEAESGGVA